MTQLPSSQLQILLSQNTLSFWLFFQKLHHFRRRFSSFPSPSGLNRTFLSIPFLGLTQTLNGSVAVLLCCCLFSFLSFLSSCRLLASVAAFSFSMNFALFFYWSNVSLSLTLPFDTLNLRWSEASKLAAISSIKLIFSYYGEDVSKVQQLKLLRKDSSRGLLSTPSWGNSHQKMLFFRKITL